MSLKFRQALEAAPLAHLQRLAGKIPGSLRNTDPSSRETSLALAARCGRLDVFEWLLLDEAHDEGEISRDARGETILHAAAGRGSSDIIALYLGQYPFVLDWVNAYGATPLHLAAMKGQIDAAQTLISRGADIDAPDLQGATPLHYAASWGHLDIAKRLVELGCDHTAKNNEGFTAAEYAFSFALQADLQRHIRNQEDSMKRARKGLAASGRKGSFVSLAPAAASTSQLALQDVPSSNVGLGLFSPSSPVPPSPSRDFSPSSSRSALNASHSSILLTLPDAPPATPPKESSTFPLPGASLSPFSLLRARTNRSNASTSSSVSNSRSTSAPTSPNPDRRPPGSMFVGSLIRGRQRAASRHRSSSASASMRDTEPEEQREELADVDPGDGGSSVRTDSFNSTKPSSAGLLALAKVNDSLAAPLALPAGEQTRDRSSSIASASTTSTTSLSVPSDPQPSQPIFYNYPQPVPVPVDPAAKHVARQRSLSNLSITSSSELNRSRRGSIIRDREWDKGEGSDRDKLQPAGFGFTALTTIPSPSLQAHPSPSRSVTPMPSLPPPLLTSPALAPVPSPLLASLALAPRFEGRSSAEAAHLTPSNEPAARESLFTKEETNSINGENPKTGGRMRWLLRRKKDAGS